MCGLFGFINSSNYGFTKRETDAVAFLCYLDTLRGADGTGLLMVEKEGEVQVLKTQEDGPTFLKTKELSTLSSQAISRGKALLGHNRKGTVGGFDDEHAHPFVIDDKYVFMHNGKLDYHTKYFNTDVDSEALGKLLCPLSEDPRAMEAKLGQLSVAMATVWYDMENHKVYFLRNYERPLYYMFTADKGFVYASEKWMLNALREAGTWTNTSEPVSFAIDTLYSIDLAAKEPTLVEEDLTIKKVSATYTVVTSKTATKTKSHGTNSSTKATSTKTGNTAKSNCNQEFFRRDSDAADEALSKSRYKKDSRNFLGGSTVAVWVDDVIPMAGGSDWLIYATHDNYPGWVFEWQLRGQTKIFVEEEVEGRLIYGKVSQTKFEREIQKGIATLNPTTTKISPRSFLSETGARQCH